MQAKMSYTAIGIFSLAAYPYRRAGALPAACRAACMELHSPPPGAAMPCMLATCRLLV